MSAEAFALPRTRSSTTAHKFAPGLGNRPWQLALLLAGAGAAGPLLQALARLSEAKFPRARGRLGRSRGGYAGRRSWRRLSLSMASTSRPPSSSPGSSARSARWPADVTASGRNVFGRVPHLFINRMPPQQRDTARRSCSARPGPQLVGRRQDHLLALSNALPFQVTRPMHQPSGKPANRVNATARGIGVRQGGSRCSAPRSCTWRSWLALPGQPSGHFLGPHRRDA